VSTFSILQHCEDFQHKSAYFKTLDKLQISGQLGPLGDLLRTLKILIIHKN